MHTRRVGVDYAVGLVLALAAVDAVAADNPPVSATLEDVVVTATKRQEKLFDVAMGISAVSGDDLVRRQERGFIDFASQVPGLSLEVATPGQIRLVLRGANVGSVGATVATVVDDIPFSMSGAQSDGAFFGANVDTFDLQRIEVLRGPQGTLYGATAEGGLIKYVTNAPNTTKFESSAYVGGEKVNGGDSTGKFKGMINVPFWDGKAAFRLSGVRDDSAGWIDNPLLGKKNANSIDKYSFRGSVLVKPSDALTIRASAFRQMQESFGGLFSQVVGAALTPATPPANKFQRLGDDFNSTLSTPVTKNQLSYYALNVEYAFKAATLMSSTSYGKNDIRAKSELTNGNVAPGLTFADLFAALVYGQPIAIVGNQLDFVHKFNQELRLTSNPGSTLFGHGFDWQGGLFFTKEQAVLFQPFDVVSAANTSQILAPPIGAADIPSDFKETSFFVDFTYHFTDWFDLEFGGRHSKTKQNSQVKLKCCVIYGPDTDFAPLFSDESRTTWSVAPRFKIGENSVIYARVATGYRAGGPNLPTPTLPNPPLLAPDSTRNYEVGFRTQLFDKRLSLDITAFLIDWKDAQILSLVQTSTGPVGINGNAGKAKSKGVEWSFNWRPVDRLSVGLTGAYTDAKLTTDAVLLGALKGDELPQVPDVSTALNIDYSFPLVGDYAAYVGTTWAYSGSRYTNFSSSPVNEAHVKLPSYTTGKVQFGVDNGKFNAQLYVNNLTDERGINNYSSSGGLGQTGLVVFTQPRTYGVELGVKF